MKRFFIPVLLTILSSVFLNAQNVITGSDAAQEISGTEEIRMSDEYSGINYLRFSPGKEVPVNDFGFWAQKALKLNENHSFKIIDKQTDKLGYEHIRMQLHHQGIPLLTGMIMLHVQNGMIESLNGYLPGNLHLQNSFSISKKQAREKALNFVDAESYKWEIPGEDQFLQKHTGDASSSFYPEGEKSIVPVEVQGEQAHAYAYKFDIYAHQPVYRADIYVDAGNGEILLENKRIHHIDTAGTANTKYSGTRPITTDYYNNQFRLRESGRGNGIETYDMNNSTSYSTAIDFTDNDNYWNNYNAQLDEVSTDAHWAMEATYDYFYQKHNRNSIDGNGMTLKSYVHYDNNYVNAFWNGQVMTFGDGNGGSITPLTTIDIVGHEITHGLTTFSANLIYQDESGALNEGFSDIFGASIEAYARPNNHNWKIGEDIGQTFRSMANPNNYQLPDTYLGNHWYTGTNDNGGVHTNNGPFSYWYYLLAEGGSGTNDNNDSYQVSKIGLDSAGAIAFRMLTVYLTPSSEYDEARFYAIKSATDLYGPCSKAVKSVTNAMHAIGVGDAYVPGVQADFTAGITSFCQPPSTVKFTNQSNNGINYSWDFGDGSSSNAIDPTHTYTHYGDYTVKLIADGLSCGIDSIIDTTLISINTNNPCKTITPKSGSIQVNNCTGTLYDDGGPGNNYTTNTNSTVTIAPPGASSLDLTFTKFHFEAGYDYLKIYNGTSTSAPLIGSYDGTSLPGGGTITASSGAVTIKQETDQYVNEEGFELQWTCSFPNVAPSADFSVSDTFTCNGLVYFQDLSKNGPDNWQWNFGDGSTSNMRNPVHQYTQNGVYDIQLKSTNNFGSDSTVRQAYVKVTLPDTIPADTGHFCHNENIVLSSGGNGTIQWFADKAGKNLLDTGNTFSPAGITKDTTFYVANTITKPSIYGAKQDNSGGGGYFTAPYEHHLVFDAYKDFILKSVKVYGGSSGKRTITLKNANGMTIASKDVQITSGQQRVNLDFHVPAGTELELGGPASPDLYRNDNGTNYPYTTAGVFSINHSSASSDPTGYYYYFYDWEIEPAPCASPVKSYPVFIYPNSPQSDFDFQKNKSKVVFQNLSSKSAHYQWDFGDGSVSSDKDPVHYYTQTGTYNVQLKSSNPCGLDSTEKSVVITEVGINDHENKQVKIYPNPAQNIIHIEFDQNSSLHKVQLLNMNGELISKENYHISQKNNKALLRLQDPGSGIYFIRILIDDKLLTKKIVVI